MGILLKSSVFQDIYGNVTNEFKANAGDRINIKHKFETSVEFLSTTENQLRVDKLENKISRGQGSFLDDGFRVGQTYTLLIVNGTNGVTDIYGNAGFHTGTITFVSDLYLKMTGLPDVNGWTNGTSYTAVLLADGQYDSLNFAFNFVDNAIPNNSSPSLESIIDQETSKFSANGLSSLSVGNSLNLVQIGKKSGQFLVMNAIISRLADTTDSYTAFTRTKRQFQISFDIIFPAMFAESYFIGDKCLRYYSKTSFKILSTESLAPTIVEYNQKANTGLWNEGFNEDQPNCTFGSVINEIFYNKVGIYTITAKCPTSLGITSVELGAMYYTIDDTLNLNQPDPQDEYLPFLKTESISASDIGNDWNSTTSTPFNLYLDSFSYVDSGGVRTFTIGITFNPFYSNPNGFGKFIEGRGEFERTFFLWIKVGNTNRLLFGNQLTFEQPVGVPITPLTSNIVNHDNNNDYKDLNFANNVSNSDFNIEDDISFVGEFNLYSTDVNESISAKVVVRSIPDDYEFVLDKITFDLTNVNLQYFINQTSPISNNLPTSSVKKEAFLYQRSGLSGNEMEIRLFYPIIIDWKYWEDVLSTHPFFVSQDIDNGNWYNYKVLPWQVYVKIEIKRNGVVDYYYRLLSFKNYDDWGGTSTIELFDTTETTQYSSLKENATILIKATHVFPSNYSGSPYGMITIEPKESSPRYILSTEIDRTQIENPLIGISIPNRCDIQFLNPTTIVLRCYVNTNLLDGNDFCISSKISEEGSQNNNPEENKITSEDGVDKLTSGNSPEIKILS